MSIHRNLPLDDQPLSMPRRRPGSGLAQRTPASTPAVRSMESMQAARPMRRPVTLGGGRPSFDFGQFMKQFSKLSFTPEVPKKWRHLSVIALAILVGAMTIDSKSLSTSADANQLSQIGGGEMTTTQAVKANLDVSLPEIKSVDLPPVPVKNDGVIEPALQASNVILVDNESKLPLYEKGADQKIAVASTTKIMTAIVAFENYKDLDKEVVLSNRAINQIGSAVGFRPGETATVRQLLYGLLLVSGNDAAMALSELYLPEGGEVSTKAFVDKMNETARRLGMKDTKFQDPAGLFDTGYSTPADMAKAMSALIEQPEAVKMIGTLNHTYYSPRGIRHDLLNSNRLLGEMYYDGMIGGKTGFTPKTAEGGAGHCLIVAAARNGHTLIAAVFDTYSNTPQASAQVARDALNYGFNNFTWQSIAR